MLGIVGNAVVDATIVDIAVVGWLIVLSPDIDRRVTNRIFPYRMANDHPQPVFFYMGSNGRWSEFYLSTSHEYAIISGITTGPITKLDP